MQAVEQFLNWRKMLIRFGLIRLKMYRKTLTKDRLLSDASHHRRNIYFAVVLSELLKHFSFDDTDFIGYHNKVVY